MSIGNEGGGIYSVLSHQQQQHQLQQPDMEDFFSEGKRGSASPGRESLSAGAGSPEGSTFSNGAGAGGEHGDGTVTPFISKVRPSSKKN